MFDIRLLLLITLMIIFIIFNKGTLTVKIWENCVVHTLGTQTRPPGSKIETRGGGLVKSLFSLHFPGVTELIDRDGIVFPFFE